MRRNIWIIFIIVVFACKQKNNDIMDEKNYKLVRTDSFYHVIASKLLVNKFDNSMHLVMYYSGDGKLMSKGFFKNKLRDGINEVFHANGKLMIYDYYKNGIKVGFQREYYPNGNLKKRENYVNGNLVSI